MIDKHFVAVVPEPGQRLFNDLVSLVWMTGLLPTTSLVINICLLAKPAGGGDR